MLNAGETVYGMRKFIVRDVNGFWVTFGESTGSVARRPCPSRLTRRIVGRGVAMNVVKDQTYDRIGAGYDGKRRADPRIADRIGRALGPAMTLVNVGAGAGSYEPSDRTVIAVEPAMTMIQQRPKDAGPVVRAYAEALPFGDGAFDAALAVLTIHHWNDWRAGLRELARVVRQRIVLFTWDPKSEGFWLRDYLPAVFEEDRGRFPDPDAIGELLGGAEVCSVPVSHDCTDGFMGAYWRRPSAYLEPSVRTAISSLATGTTATGISKLADDLETGEWHRKYENILEQTDLDLGYRLIVYEAPANRDR